MSKAADLKGKRFGKLHVLERTRGEKGVRWKCLCDCGTTRYLPTSSLVSGRTISCGCHKMSKDSLLKNNNYMFYADIKGKRFGKLIALEKLIKRRHERVVWKCKCDCGNECEVTSLHLLGGNTTSCGCKNTEDCVDGTRLRNLTSARASKMIENKNDSGVKGVTWKEKNKKWRVRITFKRQEIYLGLYKDLEEAISVRKKAEEKYFKPILEKYRGETENDE